MKIPRCWGLKDRPAYGLGCKVIISIHYPQRCFFFLKIWLGVYPPSGFDFPSEIDFETHFPKAEGRKLLGKIETKHQVYQGLGLS